MQLSSEIAKQVTSVRPEQSLTHQVHSQSRPLEPSAHAHISTIVKQVLVEVMSALLVLMTLVKRSLLLPTVVLKLLDNTHTPCALVARMQAGLVHKPPINIQQ